MDADFGTLFSLELGLAILAMVLLDLVVNPEPVLVLRRRGGEAGATPLSRRLGGYAVMIAARVALGALLFWLSTRSDTLVTLGTIPVSLATLVFLAAGALLLIRALSEIVQLSYRRFAASGEGAPAQLARGGLAMAALLAAVEPAVLGLGLAPSIPALAVGLVLGALLLLVLARPMARAINRYPHLRLLGLAAVAIIGGAMILSASGPSYPRPIIVGVVLALAILAVVAVILARRSGAAPGLEIVAPELYDLAPRPARRAEAVEPAFDEPAFDPEAEDGTLYARERDPAPEARDLAPEPRLEATRSGVLYAPVIVPTIHHPSPHNAAGPVEPPLLAQDAPVASPEEEAAPAPEELALERPHEPMPVDEDGVDETDAEEAPEDDADDRATLAPEPDEALAPQPSPRPASEVALEPEDRPVPQRLKERPRPLRGPARRRMARKDKRRS